MSMNEHETHAEVVAEMRGTDNKCQFATKDGTGCYHCPFGSAASNCLFDKFAARAEAAHKREVEKLNSVIQATVSRSDAEIDRLRREVAELRKQIGNAAKMREALAGLIDGICFHCDMSGDCKGVPCEKMQNAKAALAAPPRNCERFKTKEEAEVEFMMSDGLPRDGGDTKMRAWMCRFIDWLFAPATEQKGETDAK